MLTGKALRFFPELTCYNLFCPKYCYRIFDGSVGDYASQQVYQLAQQKDLVEVEELNAQPDHVVLGTPIKV